MKKLLLLLASLLLGVSHAYSQSLSASCTPILSAPIVYSCPTAPGLSLVSGSYVRLNANRDAIQNGTTSDAATQFVGVPLRIVQSRVIVQTSGSVTVNFDGATTSGDTITLSTTTAGYFHDTGGTICSATSIGAVSQTIGSAGQATAFLGPCAAALAASGGGVASVSGTTNEISVATGTTTPVVSAAAAFDISGHTSTAPIKKGTSLPATCGVGEFYDKTNATAGSNLYSCTATNTWTVVGGGASPAGSQFDVDFTGAGGTTFQAITGAFRVSTPAIGTSPNPSVAATCAGTCVTTYGYTAVARGIIAASLTVSAEVTASNAASLDASHHNVITPAACITNQTSTDIYRTTPPTVAPNLIGNVACNGTLNDTGITGYGFNFTSSASWPSSQGLLVPDSLRANAQNGLAVGPDYLYKTKTCPSCVFFGSVADGGWEVSADMAAGTSAGMYNAFTVYNANSTGARSIGISSWFCDAKLNNDGTSGLQDCGITDGSVGNPTSGIAIFTLSPLDSFWNCTSPCGTIDTGGVFWFGSVVPTDVAVPKQKAPSGQHCTLQIDDAGTITKTAVCA